MSNPAMRAAFGRALYPNGPTEKHDPRLRDPWFCWSLAYTAGLAAGAATERETCAKVCEKLHRVSGPEACHIDAIDCAAAIRARKEKR